MKPGRTAASILLALFGLLPLGCSSSSDDPGPGTRIAFLAPLTGKFAGNGIHFERALTILEGGLNQQGGVANQPLQIVTRDTHSSLDRGFSSAQQLLSDPGVLALIGPDDAELATKIESLVANEAIANVLPSLALPAVRTEHLWFRIGPALSAMACAFAEETYSAGHRNVLIVEDDSPLHRAFATKLAATFAAWNPVGNGKALTTTITIDSDRPSFKDALGNGSPANVEAVVLLTSDNAAATLVQQWLSLSHSVAWFLAPELMNEAFLANAPPGSMEGAEGIGPAIGNATRAREFDDAFQSRFGDLPTAESYYYFDALALLSLATEAAAQEVGHSPTRTDVLSHIPAVTRFGTVIHWNEVSQGLRLLRQAVSVRYEGISGPLDLNANGNVDETTQSFRILRINSGRMAFRSFAACVPYE